MKKSILTFLFGIMICMSAMGQKSIEVRAKNAANRSLERVSTEIKLTETEKEAYLNLKKEQLSKHFEYVKQFKENNSIKFKEKVRANGKDFRQKLNEAFGKERAKEIMEAQKKKK